MLHSPDVAKRDEEVPVEKKQSRTTTKSTPKAKVALRKVTVRDLEPRKDQAVKAGAQGLTIGQRCR